jgi:hypothetical protein
MPRDKTKELRELPRQFASLSPAARLFVSLLVVIGLGLIVTAERDIQLRPDAQVRGSKLLWRVVCLNVLGAAVYLRWGRRSS